MATKGKLVKVSGHFVREGSKRSVMQALVGDTKRVAHRVSTRSRKIRKGFA